MAIHMKILNYKLEQDNLIIFQYFFELQYSTNYTDFKNKLYLEFLNILLLIKKFYHKVLTY